MKCLIIDDIHSVFLRELENNGLSFDYRPDIIEDEVYQIIGDYDGLVLRSKMNVREDLLVQASKLKFVARAGAGVDNIDELALEKRGIALFSASEGNRDAVAEHAVGLILTLFNKIVSGSVEVKNFKWLREENRGIELNGRTVGIIGYGNIGSAFAERLKGFGCDIIAYDKYKTGFGDDVVREVTLKDIHKHSDVLSLHIPLTDETNSLVNENFINQFDKPIWVINTARGKVLNLKDLEEGLKIGKVLGAGLDVLENEKMETLSQEEKDLYQRLFDMENVVLTPHVAGWSVESYEKIALVLAEKVISTVQAGILR